MNMIVMVVTVVVSILQMVMDVTKVALTQVKELTLLHAQLHLLLQVLMAKMIAMQMAQVTLLLVGKVTV